MSVYEIFVTETDIKIGLWKLTETPEELQALGNNSLYYDLFKKHHTVKDRKKYLPPGFYYGNSQEKTMP